MLKNQINFEKTIYYSVIIFAFILPLSRALISFFIIFLPLIWLFQGEFEKKYNQIKSSKVLLAISFFLLLSLISFIWTENLKLGMNVFLTDMYLFTLFVIATSIKKEQVQLIISSFLLGMFISEIIAYGVFFELWTFKNATVTNPSPFMMHIDYSVFMAFTSILLLNRILSNYYTLKQKLIYLLFFITVTGNLFLAIGRTGQVAFIVGILLITIIHFRLTIKSVLISILLLSVIFPIAYNVSDTFKVRVSAGVSDIEKISEMNFNSSWGIRVAYYIVSFDAIKENPLLGIGIGDYKDAIASTLEKNEYPFINEKTKKFMTKYHPHSQYLLILLQMGAIGLLLFFYLIYQLYRLKIKDKEIKDLSILFTTVFFISSIPEPLLVKQFTIALFILFIGLFSIESTTSKIRNSNHV